jgi:hypothetical protein
MSPINRPGQKVYKGASSTHSPPSNHTSDPVYIKKNLTTSSHTLKSTQAPTNMSNQPSQVNGQINSVVGTVEQIAGKVIEAGVSRPPITPSFVSRLTSYTFLPHARSSRPSEDLPSLAS